MITYAEPLTDKKFNTIVHSNILYNLFLGLDPETKKTFPNHKIMEYAWRFVGNFCVMNSGELIRGYSDGLHLTTGELSRGCWENGVKEGDRLEFNIGNLPYYLKMNGTRIFDVDASTFQPEKRIARFTLDGIKRKLEGEHEQTKVDVLERLMTSSRNFDPNALSEEVDIDIRLKELEELYLEHVSSQ
jgi:hypothetical protein